MHVLSTIFSPNYSRGQWLQLLIGPLIIVQTSSLPMCNKPGHIAKYCKLSKRVKNLNLDKSVLNQIQNLLLEDSENSDYAENEFENSFNQIENDDLDSSESEQDHTSQVEALISIASKKDSSLPSSLKKQNKPLELPTNKLGIGYKLSDVEVRTSIGDSIILNSTSFVLVKDITNPVILGTPFIEELILFRVTNQGIEIESINISLHFDKPPIKKVISTLKHKEA
ncbi:hypothetical protein H5410_057472 [Solanum commersonii]|uniref:CCHC-type domain-containing protein n=1 Tax=Solanum commersonii TaxID=4109 RepID=A0A9J5WP45_SOLCO|nr:hypothetical protein H5410_057472 [Solanum commersonii]